MMRWRGRLGGAGGDTAARHRWEFVRAELAGNAYTIARRLAEHRVEVRRRRRPYWWDAPTMEYLQVGRAGSLTLAQAWRANGGQWTDDNSGRDHGRRNPQLAAIR